MSRYSIIGFMLFAGMLKADVDYWPMLKYDAKRTGQSIYPGPGCCDEKWKFEGAGNYYYSSPAVRIVGSDTMVYVGNKDHYLYAVADCGDHSELRWRYPAHGNIMSSPAIGSDGIIHVGDDGGYLLTVNQDGSLDWEFPTNPPFNEYIRFSSPVIGSDGTIYVGSADVGGFNDYKSLYAINPNGTFKWKYATDGWVNSSPALGSDGTIYVGSDDARLYAINPDSTLKWSYQAGGKVCSTPAIASDGIIYFSAFDGYLYALSPDGVFKWKYFLSIDSIGNPLFPDIVSSPAIGNDGTVYIGGKKDTVHAVNPDGTRKWATGVPAFHPEASGHWNISSSPALSSDGYLYIGLGDNEFVPGRGGLALLEQSDGGFICGYCTENEVWDSPAVGPNYTVYFGDCSGDILYAIQCLPLGVEEENAKGIEFLHAYPNPFQANSSIKYAVAQLSPVSVKIHNVCGKSVKVIVDEMQQPGIYEISWDGTDNSGKSVAGGIYYCRLQCRSKKIVKKVLLIR